MERSTIRRLSFGASKVSFPMDKYMRCLNNTEKEEQQIMTPTSTMDPQQFRSIEIKHASVQYELASLEAQYMALLQKRKFLNALREEQWPSEYNVEYLNREIKSMKRDRDEQERHNREALGNISNGIHQIIENQQASNALREAAKVELQEVKKQITEILTSPRQNRHKEMSKISTSLLPETKASDSRYVHQAVSLLSGLSIVDIGSDYKTFGVSIPGGDQYRITVVYVQNKINDAVVHPEIELSSHILSYARAKNNLSFLLSEIIATIYEMTY
eukprot:TRINITY_DN15384_c0_g1_i1.p1 TRINITY_DN15384_c0_g1~~TRINITY_DN15384_c0_g1_i1.p1  ORF type:complete len:273 (-),score=43.76 TRINITY_DN15384_c0_g1_i1:120-938(-)